MRTALVFLFAAACGLALAHETVDGPTRRLEGATNIDPQDLLRSSENMAVDQETASSVVPDNTDPQARMLLRCSACRACSKEMYNALMALPSRIQGKPGLADKDIAMLEASEDVVKNFGYPVQDKSKAKPGGNVFFIFPLLFLK